MKWKYTHEYDFNLGSHFQKDKLSYVINKVSCADEHIDLHCSASWGILLKVQNVQRAPIPGTTD